MDSPPGSPRSNQKMYTKKSTTATRQFSEEMQKRRKPFLLNETEPINARISIKRSNKENTRRLTSPYNKNNLSKTLELPVKHHSINTTQYRTKIDCPVLQKYHHTPTKALREFDSNFKATYQDISPGKIVLENIPIKSYSHAKETIPLSNYQGKTSIDFYQAPKLNCENKNITSDVEQLLKMHKDMTELKQKLEEKYKNTLKNRDQLISCGSISNETFETGTGTETDNILATIHEKNETEVASSQKIFPKNLQGTSELITATTLLSLAKASGTETQAQQSLSLITDELCNAKSENLNETVRLFTKLLKPNEANGNETCELQTFAKGTFNETYTTAETGNSKRETLIRKINLLRHVMVLTSRAAGGNDTSGYQSLTEEEFNNYKTERLTKSTPLTTTATNAIETGGNENIETAGVSFESITTSSLLTTTDATGNEIIHSTGVKEETKSARKQSLFALNEALKNAKTLAGKLESLTNIIEDTNGIEANNSSRSLSLVTKDENKFDIESINRCLELLNKFLTTTETNRLETTGHNSTFCTQTNGSEINFKGLGLLTKEINNIEEENLDAVLNFLKTSIETSGNKERNLTINEDLEALQITITVKETSGIETPRFLTQLIPELNKTQQVDVDEVGTPQSLKSKHFRQSRLKRNLPYISNKIKTIRQIPNEIAKIPKKYLTYRAQNAESSSINKGDGHEAMASQGDEGEKETRVGKNPHLKLLFPIKCLHNLKNFVNPKRCTNDVEEQKGHYEMARERKTKAMGELLDKSVTKAVPHMSEGVKNKQEFCRKLLAECGPKQSNVEQYGGMLYGLWDAVKKYPFEAQVKERESGESGVQPDNAGESREMKIENDEICKDERAKNVDILKEERDAKIKEREKKCEKNEQSEIIGQMELDKQELMPQGSQYSNVGKIPKKIYDFRKSFRSYFAKEEKTKATDAKSREAEDCATEENDSDDRNKIDRMAEDFTGLFHM